jgi:two-component system response regulator FixJ
LLVDKRIIHVVDDEEAIRRSIGFMLKTSGFTVHSYASGNDFLATVKNAETGCVLMDIRMPGIDGLEVHEEMRRRGIMLPVVVLTGHGDVNLAVRAIKGGAIDFLEKPFEKAALIHAIEEAFRRIEEVEQGQVDATEARSRLGVLTPRERDVLEGLVKGHPNKTIAYDLGISTRTVEVHRANLMTKLGGRSLSDALRLAFAAGVGRDEPE